MLSFAKVILTKMSNTCDSHKTWSKFEAKKKDGSVLKLRIQDLPKNMKDDALEFLIQYYMKEEAFQVAAGISKNETAIEEYREGLKMVVYSPKTHTVICCEDKPDITQIIGLSFMQVSENTDTVKDLLKEIIDADISKEMEQLLKIFKVLEDYSEKMPYKSYYEGRGMAVHPDYRGLGLSNEFVRLRKVICEEHDIPMTCAWMTAIATQKAAEKYNWKTFTEISLDELDKLTGLTFEKKVQTYKLMYTTIH